MPLTDALLAKPPLAADVAAPVPRVAAIGGGTGLPVVLGGLADVLHGPSPSGNGPALRERISAIVTVGDDGGSSGRLRRELGVLPPGDIRNCLSALSCDRALADLLQFRFEGNSDLRGHAVGNLVLAALTQLKGNLAAAADEMSRLLLARGRVYPSTLGDVRLQAEFADGAVVDGETAIVEYPGVIRRMRLVRPVAPFPDVLQVLINADVVVIGPGSLYTSVLPNLLVSGISATLSAVRAVRIYVANLMTQPGETDGFTLEDHLDVIRQHTGRDLFDYVLVNSHRPSERQIARYGAQRAEPVRFDPERWRVGRPRLVAADLLDSSCGRIRHDGCALAAAILRLARRGRPGASPAAKSPGSARGQTKFSS